MSMLNTMKLSVRRSMRAGATGLLGIAIAIGASSIAPAAYAADVVLADGSSVDVDVGDKVRIVYAPSAGKVGSAQNLEGKVKFVLTDAKSLVVEARVGARTRDVPVRWSDIGSLEVVGGKPAARKSAPASGSKPGAEAGEKKPSAPGVADSEKKTVFIMPWEGTVGIGARHDEILKIAAEADKIGPGQIIVLQIISPGGLVIEGDKIDETLNDLKKRHRVIAWIKEAISAAAFTSLHCEEIYFMRVGTIGAITMFSGTKSIEGSELEAWVKKVGDVAEEAGRSRWIGEAMVTNAPLLSYSKDDDGNVTWFNTLEGDVDLSDETENLTLNADVALDCKFSDGTADTVDQLLELLHLDREKVIVSDVGFNIHRTWQKTLADCLDVKIKLIRDVQNPAGSEDVAQIGSVIKAINELIGWWDRCPPCLQYESPPVPPKEELQKQVKALRKQLADIQKRRRG